MTFLVEGSVGAGAAEMEKRMGSRRFPSGIKSTEPSNRLEVAAGGITFKTESTSNFGNIFLKAEREFDEPNTGLEGAWAELPLRLGRLQ